MSNYSITFKSLRAGTVYTVNIGGGTGTPVPLMGGAQPFTTQEDDDDDMFTPVRTQSGYLRIVDNGSFDWKSLLPATAVAMPVTLTKGGTTLWQGFMQSQNFGSTLYVGPQEREYPIQCALASIDGKDIVDATDYVTEMKNFAFYLKRILDYVYTVSSHILDFDNIYVQGGTYAQNALLKLIDPLALAEIDVDENTISAQYNMLDVLEDICRYWGWTARTSGRNLILTGVGFTESRFLRLTKAQLTTMAGGTAAGTLVSPDARTIGNVFASTDNELTLVRGFSKATVHADAGGAANDIIDLFPEYIVDHMSTSSRQPWEYYGKNMMFLKEAASIDGIDLAGSTLGTSKFYTAKAYEVQVGLDITSVQDSSVIYIGAKYDGTDRAKLNTKFEHNYAACVIELEADTYVGGEKMVSNEANFDWGNKYMYMRIGIGPTRANAKWFNGSGWQNTATTVKMTICNQSSKLFYKVSGTIYDVLHSSRIEVPDAAGYYGKLWIDFLGTEDEVYYRLILYYDFALVNFKVSYEYGLSFSSLKAWDKSSKEASSSTPNIVDEQWETDCIYCSYGGVKYGYGVIADPNGKPMTLTQEQNLANRVAAYWGTSKRQYDTDLRAEDSQVAAVSPTSEATIDSTACYPIAIGREWRDDVAAIKMIQK